LFYFILFIHFILIFLSCLRNKVIRYRISFYYQIHVDLYLLIIHFLYIYIYAFHFQSVEPFYCDSKKKNG